MSRVDGLGHVQAGLSLLQVSSPHLRKNLLRGQRGSLRFRLCWSGAFSGVTSGVEFVPALDVLTLYRIITVFLTLVFRGSCDSSPSSCYSCVRPAIWPRHGPAERPGLVSIFFRHKSLEAKVTCNRPLDCLLLLLLCSSSGCRPAGSDRRHRYPRQPPHSRRHHQGQNLHPARRCL